MNEWSRPVRLDRLSAVPAELRVEAEPVEREALARRFGLLGIERLRADVRLVRHGELVRAEGELDAAVRQACVATDEPVEAEVSAPFSLVFHPEAADDPADERELSEGELDVLFYAGDSVDVGEAAAETLFLHLDPFPRAPDADEALRAAGVKTEEEARVESSPFGALAGLKAKLAKDG